MLNKQKLYWSLQLGGWAFYAIVQIAASVIAAEGLGVSTQRIIFFGYEAVFCLLLTHGYRHYINKWKWLGLGMPRLIPKVIVTVCVLGAIMYFLRIPISFPLRMYSKEVAFDPENIFWGSLYYVIIFFLWSILYFIYNYFERYNKSLKLEAYAREIELNNLKSQLNPHFIFNALNSVRALVDENPEKSKLAINQLSSILRNSLVADKRGLTRFKEELKVVKDYLGLESIRFEERLRTEFIIDPLSTDFLVPPPDDPDPGGKRHQARDLAPHGRRPDPNQNGSEKKHPQHSDPEQRAVHKWHKKDYRRFGP